LLGSFDKANTYILQVGLKRLYSTPIINGLVDVYGYLRFLKIRPWYDFTEFQGQIGRLEKKNRKSASAAMMGSLTMYFFPSPTGCYKAPGHYYYIPLAPNEKLDVGW
jgi:hypothetical protein